MAAINYNDRRKPASKTEDNSRNSSSSSSNNSNNAFNSVNTNNVVTMIMVTNVGCIDESSDGSNVTIPVQRIRSPNAHDVLKGRGGITNNHSGNKAYREYVRRRKIDYNLADNKKDKTLIATEIVKQVQEQYPTPGRFLTKDTTSPVISRADGSSDQWWIEIDDSVAIAKTMQALREGAAAIRDQAKSNQQQQQQQLQPESTTACTGTTSRGTVATLTPPPFHLRKNPGQQDGKAAIATTATAMLNKRKRKNNIIISPASSVKLIEVTTIDNVVLPVLSSSYEPETLFLPTSTTTAHNTTVSADHTTIFPLEQSHKNVEIAKKMKYHSSATHTSHHAAADLQQDDNTVNDIADQQQQYKQNDSFYQIQQLHEQVQQHHNPPATAVVNIIAPLTNSNTSNCHFSHEKYSSKEEEQQQQQININNDNDSDPLQLIPPQPKQHNPDTNITDDDLLFANNTTFQLMAALDPNLLCEISMARLHVSDPSLADYNNTDGKNTNNNQNNENSCYNNSNNSKNDIVVSTGTSQTLQPSSSTTVGSGGGFHRVHSLALSNIDDDDDDSSSNNNNTKHYSSTTDLNLIMGSSEVEFVNPFADDSNALSMRNDTEVIMNNVPSSLTKKWCTSSFASKSTSVAAEEEIGDENTERYVY